LERIESPAFSGMSAHDAALADQVGQGGIGLHRLEAGRIFAAFAGVRLAADAVHREASTVCASVEMEPSDMAPVAKRVTMLAPIRLHPAAPARRPA
jgi:hypothetical protein